MTHLQKCTGTCILVVLCLLTANAQQTSDKLVKRDGTSIAGKVIEITSTDVKYKKATNLDGPTYSIPKRSLNRIEYKGGEVEDLMADVIIKKDGTSLDAKIVEVTASQIKYKSIDEPDGKSLVIEKNEVKALEYANGEKVKFLPDIILLKDKSVNLEVGILDITYWEIKYQLYNDPEGNVKYISKSDVSSIVFADGATLDLKDWVGFASETFLVYSRDGKSILTDLTFPDNITYLCYWNTELEFQRKYPFNYATEEMLESARYNWQMVADDGSYVYSNLLYSPEGKVETKMLNQVDEPFKKTSPTFISPDGKRIVIYNLDINYFNLRDRNKIVKNRLWEGGWDGFVGGISCIRFSHNSQVFLIARNDDAKVQVQLFESSKGDKLGGFKAQAPFWTYASWREAGPISFSPDDKSVLWRNGENDFGLWDLQGKLIRSFPHPSARVSAFSHDGKTLVTSGALPNGQGGSIKIWNVAGTLVKDIPFPANPSSVEFTPADDGLAILIDGSPLWLWASNDYKLPEGLDKELIEISKYEAELNQKAQKEKKERDEIARRERNADFWFKMGETLATGLENNKRETDAFKAKLQGRVDQTNRELAAIDEANKPKPVAAAAPVAATAAVATQQTPSTAAKKEVKCNYAVYFSEECVTIPGYEASCTSTISGIYTTQEERGEYKTDRGVRYVYSDERNAVEKREDILDNYEGKKNWKVLDKKVDNKCK